MGKYSVNVKQAGDHAASMVGDHAQLIANFTPGAAVPDLLKLLQATRAELEQMDVPADVKDEANIEVERAMMQAKKTAPNKATLLDSLKNAADIVKNASSIALGGGQFWTLIRKAIAWAR